MKRFVTFIFIVLIVTISYAQTDTLIFKNGNIVIGEVKNMNRGVITIETDYSDSDFNIEWEKVAEIYSQQNYIISLDNGEREKSKIRTDRYDKSKIFLDWSGAGRHVVNDNVVYIKPVEGASNNDYVFQTTFGWEL